MLFLMKLASQACPSQSMLWQISEHLTLLISFSLCVNVLGLHSGYSDKCLHALFPGL